MTGIGAHQGAVTRNNHPESPSIERVGIIEVARHSFSVPTPFLPLHEGALIGYERAFTIVGTTDV